MAVKDNGVGVNPADIERVFEPFFTTKPSGQGTGLGLSTVYGIVRQFRGWISVRSEQGEGTVFSIWLPVRDEGGESAAPPADLRAFRGSETVLLVEDDDAVRHAAAAMLRSFGYAVVAAPGPEDALRLVEDHAGRIDLLLSDVMMPGMTGPALARQLRQKKPDLKLMLMSGYREDAADAGLDFPFISKPFTAEGLARRVRAVLDA
jgi:CheY-like chemotaxis protein